MASKEEQAFLAGLAKKSATLKKVRTVKAGGGFVSKKEFLEAYAAKKDKDKWNETAVITGGSFGGGVLAKDASKDRGPFVRLSYVFASGPLKGKPNSSQYFLDAAKSESKHYDRDEQGMVDSDDAHLLSELCKALQRCGIESTDEFVFEDLPEIFAQFRKDRPVVNLRLSKSKRKQKDKDGNLFDVYCEIASYVGPNSSLNASKATDDEETEGAEEEEQEETPEDEEAPEETPEDEGFFEGDIVAYRPPRARAKVDCEVGKVEDIDKKTGKVNSYTITQIDGKKTVYTGIKEDELTLVKATDK